LLSHFQVDVDAEVGAGVLKLHGELDVASSVLLTEQLEKLSAVEFVIVDLSELEFIDSRGIGVLVKAHQTTSGQGRRFAVVNGTGQVAQMLELTGLAEQLTVVDTLAELLDG
jgi:anti-sigma B factor antagonist